jgi:hypothetical protein
MALTMNDMKRQLVPPDGAAWAAFYSDLVFALDVDLTDAVAAFPGQRGSHAADYLLSTPDAPTPEGQSNPWYDRLDRTVGLGITGHSGGGGLSLGAGLRDDRFDAIVAQDPAGESLDLIVQQEGGLKDTPTMVQVADYPTRSVFVPRRTKPEPEPGSKYTYFDTLRAAGVDAMQVSIRATQHYDWVGLSPNTGASTYGERVAAYCMLAWFDRYIRGALDPAVAADALRRLTATDKFDGSADAHSIGAGLFDPAKAQAAGVEQGPLLVPTSIESGNAPLTIKGQLIHNRLSWWYPTRYVLDGGALHCDDVRAGCP